MENIDGSDWMIRIKIINFFKTKYALIESR